MGAAIPGEAPIAPPRTPNRPASGQTYGSYSSPPLPTPPTSQTNEFGAGVASNGYVAGSASRRPLPMQPPVGLPSNPYPTTNTYGIASGRRTLPQPPSFPSGPAPIPPPRPTGRALPTLPPAPSQVRVPSGTHIPDSPTTSPRRPLPPTQYSQIPAHSTKDSRSSTNPNVADYTGIHNNPSMYDSPTSIEHRSQSDLSRGTSLTTSMFDSSVNSHITGDNYTVETDATSAPSRESVYNVYESLYNAISKTEDEEEGGTNVTLRPPVLVSPGPLSDDGRRTPTAANWADDLEPPNLSNLDIEPRKRTISTSTIGALDAGLPITPTFPPQRTLAHQRSFGDVSSGSSGVSFPVPHLALSGNDAEASSSRSSSRMGRISQFGGDLSFTPHHPSQPIQAFPEPRASTPSRQSSQTSSLHPSIASRDRRRDTALSPSWNQQSQPPSSWVQHKLQIHQSHVDDQYTDDDGSYRRESAYEEDILDDYDDDQEEEAEEVNEIRFFQPAFLSEAALQLRDRVERRRQMKAGIAWVGSFTGRDIVVSSGALD